MGQLPPDRLTPYVRLLTHTGVYLFGPPTEKRWKVIFTFMTYRATHFELVSDLSTDAVFNLSTKFRQP